MDTREMIINMGNPRNLESNVSRRHFFHTKFIVTGRLNPWFHSEKSASDCGKITEGTRKFGLLNEILHKLYSSLSVHKIHKIDMKAMGGTCSMHENSLGLWNILVEKLQIKRPVSRSISNCGDNIKMDFIEEMCWHRIQLTQGRVWN
jgi:hypothetical protein